MFRPLSRVTGNRVLDSLLQQPPAARHRRYAHLDTKRLFQCLPPCSRLACSQALSIETFIDRPSLSFIYSRSAQISPCKQTFLFFPSDEFVLDTCPFSGVLHTHGLQEWGPRVVLHCCFSQAARLVFSSVRVCDASTDSLSLWNKSSDACVSTSIFLVSARSCRNSVLACKLTRWWEVS
jgi:hypothetical protein